MLKAEMALLEANETKASKAQSVPQGCERKQQPSQGLGVVGYGCMGLPSVPG